MDIRIKKSIEVINYVIDDLKFDNPKQFSDSLGFKRPERIYKILRGETGISRKLAEIINEKYPQYDKNWLLTGEGEMKKGEAGKEEVKPGSHAAEQENDYRNAIFEMRQEIRSNLKVMNDNIHALSEGMITNVQSLANGQIQIMKNQLKIIQFTETLDPQSIAIATIKLNKFLEEQENKA